MKALRWYAVFLIQVFAVGILMEFIEAASGVEMSFTYAEAAIAVIIARIGMMQTEANDERP